MAKKSGGRLPFQAFIARSVCIAHAIVDATQGPDLVIIEQSREVKAITRIGTGLYFLALKHPLTYFEVIDSPPIHYYLYGHARAHIDATTHSSEPNAFSFVHMFEKIVNDTDPIASTPDLLAIGSMQFTEGWQWTDSIFEVSVFDVLEPEKRYIPPPQGPMLKAATPKINDFARLFLPRPAPAATPAAVTKATAPAATPTAMRAAPKPAAARPPTAAVPTPTTPKK